MSDISQGDGWWQASDLKWYPPDLHADPAHRLRHDVATVASPPEAADPRPAPRFPLIEGATPPPATPPAAASPEEMAARSATPLPGREAPPSQRRRSLDGGGRSALLWGGGLVMLVGMVGAALILAFLSSSGDDERQADPPAPVGVEDTATNPDTETPPATTTGPADQIADPPEVTAGTEAGSTDQPAAFGQVWGWPEWRGSIVDVIDTAGTSLVDTEADPPPPGRTHLVVLYEATYLGSDVSAFEPFLIDSPNALIHENYACFVDPDELDSLGVDYNRFELVPGQTARFVECLEVSIEDVVTLTLSLDNVNQFAQAAVFAADGAELPALDPPPIVAGQRVLDTAPLGTELRTDQWTAAVTEIFDATEAQVVADFADPPRDGHTYLAVAFVATYEGDEPNDFIPLRVTGIGTEVYEPINNCWLDAEAMAARGIDSDRFELAPGETAVLGDCLEVPDAELDTLVIRLEDGFSFENTGVLYDAG